MGVGLNSAFNIGRKGLNVSLAGLNVTGNNIANVNTEGYSRRRVDISASVPQRLPQGIFGTGVEIDRVTRFRNEVADRQLRRQNEDLGLHEKLEDALRQIETIINEPAESNGIRGMLQQFFDNFHELANDPESGTTREVVRQHALVLTEAFNRIDQQLDILSKDIRLELDDKVGVVNDLANDIADLNTKILVSENIGQAANDLRDERDRKLDELSKLVNLYYKETSNGTMNVSIGGRTLVSNGISLANFILEDYSEGGEIGTRVIGETDNVELQVARGELRGLQDVRNEIIPEYKSLLDQLASQFIESVNNLHNRGVGIQGSAAEIPHDIDFFTGTDAGNISVASAILESTANIAAAQRRERTEGNDLIIYGEPGDNKVALELANLRQTLVFDSNTKSFDDYLSTIIGRLGVETKNEIETVLNAQRVIDNFQNIRDGVSAVSLDEELTNLIRFQRSYQANAKLITTVDELFQTLVNLV